MDIISTFKDSNVEIVEDIDKSPTDRKSEFESKVSYFTMSEESEIELRNRAVKSGLIPVDFKNASFNEEKIRANIVKQHNMSGHGFTVMRSKEYFSIANEIIATIRLKQLPKKSYLIGAPNGFGKQSFATDCILASLNNGWITVPYISLLELAELKAQNDKFLMRGLMGLETDTNIKGFDFMAGQDEVEKIEGYYHFIGEGNDIIKRPTIITGQYSWSEYINAPILVCFFSGIESKAVESQILYTLLNIRSAKGYPTIAMISTALTMYEKDPVLGKFIWKEIKSYDEDEKTYSRVYHISCYKSYNKV